MLSSFYYIINDEGISVWIRMRLSFIAIILHLIYYSPCFFRFNKWRRNLVFKLRQSGLHSFNVFLELFFPQIIILISNSLNAILHRLIHVVDFSIKNWFWYFLLMNIILILLIVVVDKLTNHVLSLCNPLSMVQLVYFHFSFINFN
jgi:hypothetical protein